MTAPLHTPEELEALREPRFDARGNSYYAPCEIGLHLCGFGQAPGCDVEQPFTAANLPAPNHATAQAMFDAARREAECPKDEADFLCDLNLGSPDTGTECVDNFYTNRQLWPRLVRASLSRTREVQK